MKTRVPHLVFFFSFFSSITFFLLSNSAASTPQTTLLMSACSRYNASDTIIFFSNLNATLTDLRSQLNSTHFATARRTDISQPVFGLFQCRDYLSTPDCISCFTVASQQIRNCSAASGARIIYDGCFLRYESNDFYDQGTQPGNEGFCENSTVSERGFNETANKLLMDLVVATPKIGGLFAAVRREGAVGAVVVYGVAQCVRTVRVMGCGDCLRMAYQNIEGCPPEAGGRAVDAGCFLRYSNTAFFAANQSVDLSSYLSGGSKKKAAIIGGVLGGVGAALLFLLLLFIFLVRSKKIKQTQKGDILGATELRGPVTFRYRDLKSATKNFSIENKLGGGGFGDVYKGVLKNGKIIAVKKLIIGQSSRAKADFESEAKLISNVHHRNLIRLLGCCSKGSELLLVYEYMANGSLNKFLFGDRHRNLNWKQRFDIILGMARGLAYLHEEFHSCIIHRDIKSSNILLDDEFQPKIADFGLARLLPEDQSHLSTKFAGTLGYSAPEYAIHGKLSETVDTYSYGIVILEIISSLKSNDMSREPAKQYLLEWAWNLHEKGKVMELLDENLDPNEYRTEEVKKIIEISLLCTQSSTASRPTMSEVVVMLLSNNETTQEPTRPAFIETTNGVHEHTPLSAGSSSPSAAM